jgi:hypothetical protein
MRASQRSCSINSAALERFRDVLVPWRERYICVYMRVPIREEMLIGEWNCQRTRCPI